MTADTSVVVAALLSWHEAHDEAATALRRVDVFVGHVVAETYAVLTRLPRDRRLAPAVAASLVSHGRRPSPLALPARDVARLPARLAAAGIGGGATYDALVGLTAAHHGHVLLTRDARAVPTYDALGVEHELVGDELRR